MTLLDGPRVPSRSGEAKGLVVLLHGYGADGNDLIDIGRQWQRDLPDVTFVSPHAPEPCSGAPYGRQWFPLTFRTTDERWHGVQHARPALDAFISAELSRLSLGPEKLALVGFSQGAMLALHTGLRHAVPAAAIISFSGLLVVPEGQDPATLKPDISARPPVLLVHGDQDEVIPPEALFFSSTALASLDVAVEFHLGRGLGHSIDADGLRLGGDFLTRAMAAKR
jgi:phospholipase/carboxylesterase